MVVDGGIEGEVGADALGSAAGYNFWDIFNCEGCGGFDAHVELFDPEVDGVCAGLDGGLETFPRAYGRHDFHLGMHFKKVQRYGNEGNGAMVGLRFGVRGDGEVWGGGIPYYNFEIRHLTEHRLVQMTIGKLVWLLYWSISDPNKHKTG